MQTSILLHLPPNKPLFYCFVFGATLLQYNLPYVINLNRQKSSDQVFSFSPTSMHHWLAGVATLLMLMSTFSLSPLQILLFTGTGIITILYSFNLVPFTAGKRLKDYGTAKIFTLTISWVIITVVLPVIDKPIPTSTLFFLCGLRLLFLWVLCLLFDIRDIAVDDAAGIKTLPVLMGKSKSRFVCYVLNSIFLIFAVIFCIHYQNLVILNAYIICGAATFLTIKFTKTNNNPVFYLACVDGLMLLQASLIIIGSI
ncbi:MAG: UbiA family prenyltransferase [Ginsengibacter sp.]